jgi:hypothetical protein
MGIVTLEGIVERGQIEPPAPLARVILRNPDTSMAWSDVPM